jgi:hypothetical protein
MFGFCEDYPTLRRWTTYGHMEHLQNMQVHELFKLIDFEAGRYLALGLKHLYFDFVATDKNTGAIGCFAIHGIEEKIVTNDSNDESSK